MKKKLRFLLILPVLALLACGVLALSEGDALVSLSYLKETFFSQAAEKGEEAAEKKLQEAYDAAVGKLEGTEDGVAAAPKLESAGLESRDWSEGDVLTLTTGGGFLLLEGTAQVEHGGAVVDVTAGTEAASGSKLAVNHRYIVGEDTSAQVKILSGAARLGVQGTYALAGGTGDPLPFYDVCQTDWFYDPVKFVYRSGVLSGMEADRFGPGTPMSRAMLMTAFYRLAGSPEKELEAAQADVGFSDVPDGAWFTPYVRWAASRGVTAGTGDGMFSPDRQVDREQLVVLLYSFGANYLGLNLEGRADLSGYQDLAQASDWAKDALAWGVSGGIISSASAGQLLLSPRKDASRAEVAAMLRAFSQKAQLPG